MDTMDKAGQEFWNELWAGSDIPKAIDPSDTSIGNSVSRRFHRVFERLFDRSQASGMTLLEVGCGKSAWLPYFAKQFGFNVAGLDYSPVGCEMARKVLEANEVSAEIVQADLFAPPAHMLASFDVVVSFGVIEHFEDTAATILALSRFLRPGGLLITSIPNMVGSIGWLQKTLNRPVYDIHQPIDAALLKQAHVQAGLEVVENDYFMSTNFGLVNLAGVSTRTPVGFVKKACLGVLARLSVLAWLVEERGVGFPPNRLTSPYINCIARKPQ